MAAVGVVEVQVVAAVTLVFSSSRSYISGGYVYVGSANYYTYYTEGGARVTVINSFPI